MWLNKESTCQWRRHRKCRFDPWVGKIPWRRKWQPTPVFLSEIPWTEEPSRLLSNWAHVTFLNKKMVEYAIYDQKMKTYFHSSVGFLVSLFFQENSLLQLWAISVQLEGMLLQCGDLCSIPGLGRSSREGKCYPLQYSGMENSETTEQISLSL